MRKTIILFLSLFAATSICGQNVNKVLNKAGKAVVSVITYDKDGNILRSGNGVFVQNDGTMLSQYELFENAFSAVTVDASGIERPVQYILGANDVYDVVKCKVQPDKRLASFTLASAPATEGRTLYLLPYSTKKENRQLSGEMLQAKKTGNDVYYTLKMSVGDKWVGCPLTNENGELVGLLQQSAGSSDTLSYAIGASFINNLSIGALSINEKALNRIGIEKALPEKLEDATLTLYIMSQKGDTEEYFKSIGRFIEAFPKSDEGYLQRALYYARQYKDTANCTLADADFQTAVELSQMIDNVRFQRAKVISSILLSDSTFNYSKWTLQSALDDTRLAYSIQPLPIYLQQEGALCFSMKDYERAYQCFYDLGATALGSPDTYYSAAKCKELLQQNDEAISLMDSAIARFDKLKISESAPYVLERALMKERFGRFREAVFDYYKYEELSHTALGASFYYLRAQTEQKAKMYQQAIDDFDRATTLEPTNVSYLTEKGLLCYKVGMIPEAVEAINRSIELGPDYADNYYILGLCQLRQEDRIGEACANFAKAKSLGYQYADETIEKNCK